MYGRGYKQPRIQGWSFSKWKRLKRGPMDT